MRFRNVVIFFFLVFLLIYPLNSHSSGLTPSGVGTKALGLGGAFRGLADDWSASYWNPAGLAFQTKSEVNFSFMVLNPRPKFTPDVTFFQVEKDRYEVGYRNDIKRYPEDKTFSLPSFSGFLKFPELNGFITGLAFFIPYRSSFEWDLFDPLPGYNNNIPYPGIDHKGDLTVLDFHPSVARQFMEGKLSLGAGISIQKGDLTLRKVDLVPSDFPYPYNYRAIENFPVDNNFEGDGWGVGANIGLLYKASPKFQIGVSVRSPMTLKLSGTRTLTVYLPNDSLTASQIEPIDPVAASHLRGYTLSSSFDSETKLKLPADLGVGVAIMPYSNLTVTVDVNLTTWSSLKELKFEEKGKDPLTGKEITEYTVPFEWKDATRFSLGLQYMPHKSLALRAGYFLDPTPTPDKTLTPLFFNSGEKNGYTLGVGYKGESFELGYSYEFSGYKEKFLKPTAGVKPESLTNLPGRYENSTHTSYFTFTYKF
ncbi:MAG: outer membrane protein transport protein [candidate division Zixibacteria bacterium]|nr:outer membrane protein transport protein [candidate division Zixibacteria bacterium]